MTKAARKKANEYARKWRAAHPEKSAEYQKRYHAAHKEERAESGRRWREANPDRVKQLGKEWREKNPGRASERRRRWREANPDRDSDLARRRKYGISPDDFARLIKEQGEACGICRRPLKLRTKAVHVDHCHKTKQVRGLLCNRCNTALGLFDESTTTIRAALDYLNPKETKA